MKPKKDKKSKKKNKKKKDKKHSKRKDGAGMDDESEHRKLFADDDQLENAEMAKLERGTKGVHCVIVLFGRFR